TNTVGIHISAAAVVTPPNIAERIYAVTTDNQLISFNSTTPGNILSALTLSGLQSGEQIVGIDFWNGALYGVGNQSRLYTLNPATGLVSTIGLAGIDFSRHNGFDISLNPGNAAYLASPASSSGSAADLYRVNLTTGQVTLVGLIGLPGDDILIQGLSVAPGY